MARIRSLDDLRTALGQRASGYTDEELISKFAEKAKLSPLEAADYLGYGDMEAGKTGNRFGASIDRYQSGLYGLGEAAAGAAGFEGVEAGLARRRRANEFGAGIASARAADQGAVDRFSDVGSVRDFGDYAAGLAINTAPYLGEIAGGALLGGATLPSTLTRLGLGAGAARTVGRGAGAAAASYPSAVGDILQSQRDQSRDTPGGERTDLGSAALGGVPYAALNLLGVEGAAARLGGFRSAGQYLDNLGGARGVAARTAVTGGRTALVEGASEVAQEGVNQYFGRMAVDPNERFLSDPALDRYGESFAGGATLGGLAGAGLGGWRRSAGYQRPGQAAPAAPMEPLDLLAGADPNDQAGLYSPVSFANPPAGPDFSALPELAADEQRIRGRLDDLQRQYETLLDADRQADPADTVSREERSKQKQALYSELNTLSPVYDQVVEQLDSLQALYQREFAGTPQMDLGFGYTDQRSGLFPPNAPAPNTDETLAPTEETAPEPVEDPAVALAKDLVGSTSDRAVDLVSQLNMLRESGKVNEGEFEEHINDLAQNKGKAYARVGGFVKDRAKTTALPQPAQPAQQTNQLLQGGTQSVGVPAVPGAGSGSGGTGGRVVQRAGVAPAGPVPAATDGVPGAARVVAPVGGAPGAVSAGAATGTPAPVASLDAKEVADKINSFRSPKMQEALRFAAGVDEYGDMVDNPLPLREAAAKAGFKTHANLSRVMKDLGLAEDALVRMHSQRGRVEPVAEQQGAEAGAAPRGDINANVETPGKNLDKQTWYRAAAKKGFDSLPPDKLLDTLLRASMYTGAESRAALQGLTEAARRLEQRLGLRQMQEAYNAAVQRATKRKVYADEATTAPADTEVADVPDDVGSVPETAGVDDEGSGEADERPAPEVKIKKRRKIIQPSIGTKGGEAHTARSLADAVKAFLNVDSLGRRVVVVDSVADLQGLIPAERVEEMIRLELGGRRPVAFAYDGKAYLIADRIAQGDERAVFLHEVGGHLGLEKILTPEQVTELVARINAWADRRDNTPAAQIAQRARERVVKAGTDQTQANSELLAYFLEEAVKAGVNPTAAQQMRGEMGSFFRTVWAAFKAAMRKFGFKPDEITPQDVVDMAYGAARLHVQGEGASSVGAVQYSIAAPDTAKSAPPASVEAAVQKLPPSLRALARPVARTLALYTRKAANLASFTEDLLNRAASLGLKSAETYKRLSNQKSNFVGEHERVVSHIARLYDALPEGVKGRGPSTVNQYLYDTTRSRLWGYKPDWDDAAVVDPEMEVKFAALGEPGQAFAKAVLQHGHDMLATKKQVVLDSTASEYDALIAAAKADGDDKAVSGYEKDKERALDKFRSLFSIQEQGPYAPLKRYGKYVVLAKSAEYLEAEAADDKAAMEKLEADEAHYYVDFAETDGQADKITRRLQENPNYASVLYREKEELRDALYGGSSVMAALSKLRANIDMQYGSKLATEDAKAERTSAAKLQEIVTELYLNALAEGSARKSELRRRNVAGDIDMVRAFESQGKADANFLGSVKFNDDIMRAVNQMRRELRTGGNQLAKSEVFNEILARHLQGMNYVDSPLVDKLTRMTSIWFLSTSPAYYLQNATQPWMISLPVMAGKHGYVESANKLVEAYQDVVAPFKDATAFGPVELESLLSASNKKLSDGEKAMLRELLNTGRIDIGFDTELGQFRIEGSGRATETWNKVDKGMRNMQQKLEALNRASTALAAYRLEAAENEAGATAYADRIIQETHGDYNRYNAPRAFNTSLGKVALQFRKFQLIQLTLLAKLARNSFSDNPAEKAIARKALGFMLGQAFVVGGAKALPVPAVLTLLFSAVFGDAGEPPEYVLRQAIGDKDVADLLLNGPLAKLSGVNFANFGGMGNVFSVLPYTDIDLSSREGVYETAFALFGGPLGGLAGRAADGVGYMQNGDYYRGVEQFMPRGFSSLMAGIRIGSEGVTQRDGDVTMTPEDVGLWQAATKIVGLQPQAQADRSSRQNAAYRIEQSIREEGARIKADFNKARRAGDGAAAGEARAAWNEYQQKRQRVGLKKQPMSELLKAPEQQKKRERNTVGGVQYTPATQGLAQRLSEL